MAVRPIPTLHIVHRAPRPPVQSEQVRQLIREHVREADAGWFQRNPTETIRIRLLIPGETPEPVPPRYDHIVILRIGDDMAFKVAIDAETAARLRATRTAVAA